MASELEQLRSRLGARLKERREAKGLSREQLASAAGVSLGFVRDIEISAGGEFGPGVFALLKVAEALELTLDSLLGLPGFSLDGLAIIDQQHVAIVEKAKRLADLEPIRLRKRFWIGAYMTPGCRIVPAAELEQIERRLAPKVEALQADEEDAGARGGHRREQ
jgi:transcriptional regulator with XRE-family HTH domain